MIAWLKGLSWIAILGAVGTAAIMVARAYRAGQMEAEVKEQEKHISNLNRGTKSDIQDAKKLQDGITVKKAKAREIRKKSEASLERLGQNETMADIAKRFNGKRVRHRSSSAS